MVSDCQKTAVNCSTLYVMKFDRSNKFDLYYYGQVNSQWLKQIVASKGASNIMLPLGVTFILLAMITTYISFFSYSKHFRRNYYSYAWEIYFQNCRPAIFYFAFLLARIFSVFQNLFTRFKRKNCRITQV